jgi:FkbM family methyltransferase
VIARNENLSLFFREYAPKGGEVVVDVGTGTGSELKALTEAVGETGRIFGFEAHSETFSEALHTIKISKLKNAEIFNLAAWDRNETVYISDGDSDTANSIMKTSGFPVEAVRLGEFFKNLGLQEEIAYLKMNIEGAEYKALLGLLDLCKPHHVCISCHDFLEKPETRTLSQVRKLLIENGYEISQPVANSKNVWENFYIFGKLPRS